MTTSASPKTATYKLQQANVLPQRAHAAAERDDKHEDADHQQHHGRVHGETRQRRLYGKRVDRGLEFFVLVHLVPIAMTDLPACLTTRAYTPIAIMDMAMSCKQSAKRGEEKLRGTVDNFIAQE